MELGSCKAGIFHPDIEFVKRKKGADGIETLDRILKSGGARVSISQIIKMKPGELLPVGFRRMFLDACFQVLDNDPEKIKEMGRNAPTLSPIQKLVMGYFLSPEKALKYAPTFWRDIYTEGEFVILEAEKNHARFAIKDFPLSKIFCSYMIGYTQGIGYLCRLKSVVCTETRCVHDGAEFCEFEISWSYL
ncbi:MAG: hypothetical protein N3F63_02050 [Thermoplasmata archaeon]|nr:hypothetical protein [Thermoplasmata archaeon]